MNEFKELLKEAFVGDEPYEPRQGRPELEAAIGKFERQGRTLRFLLWFAVTFMTVVAAGSAWAFLTADPETHVKTLILYATLFLFAGQSIGWSKMFLFTTQKHLSVLKEIKRVQLTLLERE